MPIPIDPQGKYTIQDLESWDDKGLYELICGELYYTHGGRVDPRCPEMITPIPDETHLEIRANLVRQFERHIDCRSCKVFKAPFAVCLNIGQNSEKAGGETYVIPDIVVICNNNKRQEKGGIGSLDLIVEIQSHSTANKDCIIKQELYCNAGVPEYWIVDPDTKTILTGQLVNDEYSFLMRGEGQALEVGVLSGCKIDISNVFKTDK